MMCMQLSQTQNLCRPRSSFCNNIQQLVQWNPIDWLSTNTFSFTFSLFHIVVASSSLSHDCVSFASLIRLFALNSLSRLLSRSLQGHWLVLFTFSAHSWSRAHAAAELESILVCSSLTELFYFRQFSHSDPCLAKCYFWKKKLINSILHSLCQNITHNERARRLQSIFRRQWRRTCA